MAGPPLLSLKVETRLSTLALSSSNASPPGRDSSFIVQKKQLIGTAGSRKA